MITLSDDEVALLKAILTALRGIIRDIDNTLMILSKAERSALTTGLSSIIKTPSVLSPTMKIDP